MFAQNLIDSKLGNTVSKLCKYDQAADVRAAANELKILWAARAVATKAKAELMIEEKIGTPPLTLADALKGKMGVAPRPVAAAPTFEARVTVSRALSDLS